MTLPADLKARVLESAQTTPSPSRRTGRRHAAILVAIAAGVAIAMFFAVGGFAHGEGRPAWFEATTVTAWTLAAVWATWGALRRRRSLGPTRSFLTAIAVATPLVLLVFQLQWDWTCPFVTEPIAGRIGFLCLGLGMGMGVPILLALVYARRASDPVHPVATGAALGAATGAWAGVFTDLWCPAANPSHVLLGHVLPIVLLSLLGAGLGRWVIAPQATSRATA